jgi:hypothetical protein
MNRWLTSAIAAPLLTFAGHAGAAVIYLDGVAPVTPGLVFGDHLLTNQPFGSVAGTGGSGISNNGDVPNGARTYTFDTSAQPDLTDGVANRGDPGFAMLIWDMGQAFDSMRLYTHQDHIFDGINDGPLDIFTPFVGQDVMEYSVWGSNDGNQFALLSDVVGMDLDGGGVGKPTYTFAGAAPTVVYRGGSAENGVINAYTREYVFDTAFRYYGIRTSQISLTIPGGGQDADPEIDAIAAFNVVDRCVADPTDPSCTATAPEPASLALLGLGLAGLGFRRRR